MSNDKPAPTKVFLTDGYQAIDKGYQATSAVPKVSGGHQGETSKLGKPPSGGSSSGQ